MTIDNLASSFTVGPVQCASHTLVHSPWEAYPNGQDKPSLKLGGGALQSLLDCPNPWTNYGQLSTYKEPMTCIFCEIPNAPKSFTKKKMWTKCSNQCQHTNGIVRGQLSLTLLHDVLLLGAQSQQNHQNEIKEKQNRKLNQAKPYFMNHQWTREQVKNPKEF